MRPRSRVEAILWFAIPLVLVLAPLVPAVVRTVSPQLAVDARYSRIQFETHYLPDPDDATAWPPDPWGRTWKMRPLEYADLRTPWVEGRARGTDGWSKPAIVYSTGPNGIDEHGGGDDVYITFGPRPWITYVKESLLALAATLAWWIPWLRRPRRGPWREALVIALMAAPPAVVVIVLADLLSAVETFVPRGLPAVLSPFVMFAGTVAGVCAVACLALRLAAVRPSASAGECDAAS